MGRSQESVGEAARVVVFWFVILLGRRILSQNSPNSLRPLSDFLTKTQQRRKHGFQTSLEPIKGFGWSGLADGKKKKKGRKHRWSYIDSLRKLPEWILLLFLSRVYSCNCSHYSAIMTGVVMMSDCNSCHFPLHLSLQSPWASLSIIKKWQRHVCSAAAAWWGTLAPTHIQMRDARDKWQEVWEALVPLRSSLTFQLDSVAAAVNNEWEPRQESAVE